MPDSTTVTCTFKVLSTASINLDAAIGDGQAGGIAAYLGPTLIGQEQLELARPLGTGASLVGKVLVISTTAVDIQAGTDRVSVTITLDGGEPGQPPIVQEAVAASGGAVNFLAVITFVDGGSQ